MFARGWHWYSFNLLEVENRVTGCYLPTMPKPPKRPTDVNQLAKRVVDLATGQAQEEEAPDPKTIQRGKARAAKLTPEERSKIAKKAARTRWEKE